MKKFGWLMGSIVIAFFFLVFSNVNVEAAEIIDSQSDTVFNETIGSVTIYSDGNVKIEYKYGLRRVDMHYCEKGNDCDIGIYSIRNIVTSSASNPYKVNDGDLDKYNFNIELEENVEYRVKIEVYYARSSSYTGTESIAGYPISCLVADTGDFYFNGSETSNDVVNDPRMSGLLGKAQYIVNTIVLPVIYVITSMILVVKGALLGVQIVKSSDMPDVRREKIGALKWLFIGVAIAYAATSVVGVISGFFKSFFTS